MGPLTPTQAWYLEYLWKHGEPPDMSSASDYDYAAAAAAGIEPRRAADGQYHWSSKTQLGDWLKKPGHPTRWMEDYARVLGQPPEGLPQEYAVYRAITGRK